MSSEDRISIPRSKLKEAINKLNDILQILKGEKVDVQCLVCRFWAGNCGKGRINRTALDRACELFEKRGA